MYLVSIYFDEKTNQRIRSMIKQVAEKSGNTFMIDGNVPPHITVSAFETLDEEAAVDALENVVKNLGCGELQWASVGQFFPYVIYTAPVLNEYLHDMSVKVYESLNSLDGVKISPYYRPFQWLPHTTIGKKLSKEEMKELEISMVWERIAGREKYSGKRKGRKRRGMKRYSGKSILRFL